MINMFRDRVWSDLTSRSNNIDKCVPPISEMALEDIFSQPKEWLAALKDNNVNKATRIFTSASPDFKEFLLNGDVEYYDGRKPDDAASLKNANEDMRFCITKPLHAAAIYHSNDVVTFLYSTGIDVFQVDDWQNNVFHKLIQAASLDMINENRYEETLVHIRDLLSDVEVKRLLLAENSFSLRPLEFATFHGCMEMMDLILETKGVYLYEETNVGYNIVQYFDFSDYEMFDENIPPRFYSSPLVFAMFMETSRIKHYHAYTMLNDHVLRELLHAKIKMNWPFICLWFLFRVFYTGLFFTAALGDNGPILTTEFNNTSNSFEFIKTCTSHDIDEGIELWYALSTLSAMILIHDLWEYISFRKWLPAGVYAKIRQRNSVAHSSFFSRTQILTCFSMIGITCCQMLRKRNHDIPITLDHIFFALISYGCVWGLLYFFQVLPWMSIYAIAVQRMLKDFIRFTFIFALFFVVFTLSFRRVLKGNPDACSQHFETPIESAYSTFLVIINLMDFQCYENADKISLYILHIGFVFFVVILLLNFLIAIMAKSFSDVYEQRHVIIQIQRLSLVNSLQLRLAWPLRAIYRKLQTRAFECHGRRLLIKRVTVQDKRFADV